MPPLTQLVRPAAEAARGLIKYSPEAMRGDIGFVSGQLFGIRRALERLEPQIPAYLDGVYTKMTKDNNRFSEQIKNVITKSGIKPGDARLDKVINVLEGKKPSSILDQQERYVYSWARTTYDKYSNMLGLEPNQKISSYFTHVVEPGNWRMIEEASLGRMPYASLSDADKLRYKSIVKISTENQLPIAEALDMYRRSTTQFSDILRMPGMPQSVRNSFMEARKGFPIYSKDFYQVVNIYGRAAHRKLNLEPTLRQVSLLARKLPETIRDQLETRIRHGVLYQPTKAEKMINVSFAPFDTFVRTITRGKIGIPAHHLLRSIYDSIALWDIGFSPSPVKKHFVADMMSIYAELGERWTAAGLARMMNPKMRELASKMGNVVERNTPLDIFDEYANPLQRGIGKTWRGTQKAAFYAYSKIDLINQYTAWIGAYLKAKNKGLKLKPVADMVARGVDLEAAIIEYANKVNRYTVPRQTPLDIPGIFTGEMGPLARLALQFSSKKMQRGELVWDQVKRATRGEFGPIARTIFMTAWLTGTPWDDQLRDKVGIDPERIPTYAWLKKLGFGLKDTLYALFPGPGPAAQMFTQGTKLGQKLLTSPFTYPIGEVGQDITRGPAPFRKIRNIYEETRSGKYRSYTGEYAGDVKQHPSVLGVPLESLQKAFGFDPSGARALTDELAKGIREYRDKHIEASRELSLAYYENVTQRNDWGGFYNEMTRIQGRYPDVMVTSAMLKAAVERVEVSRYERMYKHAPKEVKAQRGF